MKLGSTVDNVTNKVVHKLDYDVLPGWAVIIAMIGVGLIISGLSVPL